MALGGTWATSPPLVQRSFPSSKWGGRCHLPSRLIWKWKMLPKGIEMSKHRPQQHPLGQPRGTYRDGSSSLILLILPTGFHLTPLDRTAPSKRAEEGIENKNPSVSSHPGSGREGSGLEPVKGRPDFGRSRAVRPGCGAGRPPSRTCGID